MLSTIADVLRPLDTPRVAFVGGVSRTWYEDQFVIIDVMEILRETGPYIAVTGGGIPFDDYVEEYADRMGLVFRRYAVDDRSKRLGKKVKKLDEWTFYDRPLEMLEGLSAMVVFPPENNVKNNRVDPIVYAAVDLGIPTTAVNRKGQSVLW